MIRTVLADDHGIVLRGLRALLASEPDLEVVGVCADGVEVLETVAREVPDVLLMDLRMPRLSGLEVLAELDARGRVPPTILISAVAGRGDVSRALELGAWGVVMKDEAPALILESIHSLLDGEPWVPDPRREPGNAPVARTAPPELTDREVEVVRRAAGGASNKAIARDLGIARGTVKTHLHRVYRKLDLRNRVELALHFRDRRDLT